MRPGIEADPNRFMEVYKSKYGKVRIYKIMSVSKESKEWVMANRKCDAPGSWFCPGTYPPALQKILSEKRDFKQLEDFNTKNKEDDSDYQQQYFENLNRKGSAGDLERELQPKQERKKIVPMPQADIDIINEKWLDSELTTYMWELVSSQNFEMVKEAIRNNPILAHVRSSDGRGPMWWAHEAGNERIIKFLKKLGVSDQLTDENGLTPAEAAAASKK
jgi:dolichyl-diphosphooligosaccharide---protein glycosyltransferase